MLLDATSIWKFILGKNNNFLKTDFDLFLILEQGKIQITILCFKIINSSFYKS